MMNYIATLTIIPVPTVRHLLMSEHPLRLSKLLHRSPINYFCISESSLCLACNNNEDLNFVSWKDSPIWPCVENALSNHTARVLTNNNQPPLLTIRVLTEQALDRSPQQHGQESFLKAWLLFTWFCGNLCSSPCAVCWLKHKGFIPLSLLTLKHWNTGWYQK